MCQALVSQFSLQKYSYSSPALGHDWLQKIQGLFQQVQKHLGPILTLYSSTQTIMWPTFYKSNKAWDSSFFSTKPLTNTNVSVNTTDVFDLEVT